jgi:hypothetical protein
MKVEKQTDNFYGTSVTCKIHKKSFIDLNKKNFQIICKECKKIIGYVGTENLKMEEINSNDDENSFEKICYKHNNEEAIFYCDDCSEFICKTCFATEHRSHNSSTFDLISLNIKDGLKKTSSDLNILKKNVDDNFQSVQEINNYFISHKNSFKTTLKDINERIVKNLKLKSKEFSEEVENIFNGIDFEVESSTQRLENTKKKASKMLNDFQSLHKEVESIKSDKKVCLFKKEKDGLINENIKFLSDIQFFLNQNLEKTKNKSVKEMENFSKKCSKFQRNAEIYENSVINTIVSGIPNICMRVRRFKKYFFTNTRYFKTSSICMLTSHTINLVGFSLCGLFNNKSTDSKLDSLKVELKIYELDSVKNFDYNSSAICCVEIMVPIILNVIDPVYQFYLNNSVTINKDKVYYIFINNLCTNNYVDLWSGEVHTESKESNENQHSVICNNSLVKFNFLNAFGVESDFNEFTAGMLSDIIFSHIE